MEIYKVQFILDEKEKIVLESQDNFDELDCCYKGKITFQKNNINILLSEDVIRDAMENLNFLLKKSLNKELYLHKSITQDIGFTYNQYSNDLRKDDLSLMNNFMYNELGKDKIWVWDKHYLWAGNFVTWIYNDNDGNIILEITPLYPYFDDEKKNTFYISYDEWIKNYKPYLIRKIPMEIARQWLTQANEIIQRINANIERSIRETTKS